MDPHLLASALADLAATPPAPQAPPGLEKFGEIFESWMIWLLRLCGFGGLVACGIMMAVGRLTLIGLILIGRLSCIAILRRSILAARSRKWLLRISLPFARRLSAAVRLRRALARRSIAGGSGLGIRLSRLLIRARLVARRRVGRLICCLRIGRCVGLGTRIGLRTGVGLCSGVGLRIGARTCSGAGRFLCRGLVCRRGDPCGNGQRQCHPELIPFHRFVPQKCVHVGRPTFGR